MSERPRIAAASFVFLEHDGKILLLRRLSPWRHGKFDVPAGYVEHGETFLDAACRELKEEVGVTVTPSDLRRVHTLEYPMGEHLYVFFHTTKWFGEPRIMEPESHSELTWAKPDEWPDPVDYTQAVWKRVQAGESWSIWTESL